MKKPYRRPFKILLIIVSAVFLFLAATTVYHHASLKSEADKIVPNGTLVDVNGRGIHVYSEGEKGEGPTLVFMSGSATAAPAYDFKPLYELLSGEYRTVVVEKAGYGYSDIVETERDLDSMLEEVRLALELSREEGPFVLLPHSMSGLEALYWAQEYPEEVAAIVGLDMSVPEGYEYFDAEGTGRIMSLGKLSVWLGLHRIPGVYPIETAALSEDEINQQKLLMYRNALNADFIIEGEYVLENAMKVKAGDTPDLPVLMFTSNGRDIGDYWVPCQENFADEIGAELIYLDCGHYIHHYESEKIAEKTLEFLSSLN